MSHTLTREQVLKKFELAEHKAGQPIDQEAKQIIYTAIVEMGYSLKELSDILNKTQKGRTQAHDNA